MLILQSPAKINLFLRILHRRPDGYHEVASLLQAISLFDNISFALDDRDHLTCTDPTIPTDHANLVLKAADLFRSKTGMTFGLKAHLEKNIPHQAGLGGGSGNAATTLWALNELCGRPAEEEDLAVWAGEIGSDISFFFSPGSAYCTGRGEKIMATKPVPQTKMWIVKPHEGLSTPAVYKRLDVALLPPRDPEQFLNDILSGRTTYFNDLETPALHLMPSLAAFKQSLIDSGFHTVVMSGSGSAFFCIGNATPPPNTFSAPVHFLRRSPGAWY